jgi:AraC-like DNA-binding protein
MSIAIENIAETTDMVRSVAVLDDVLRPLRVTGSILLRETYASPWAVAIPDQSTLSGLLETDMGARLVAFHLVEFGHCLVTIAEGEEVLLGTGDLAICFGGGRHLLSLGEAAEAIPVEALLAGGKNPRRPETAAQPAGTSLLCGVFRLHHTACNPLFAALPAILKVSLSRPGQLHNLHGVARLMAEELDRASSVAGYIVERLLEVLLADALRAHIESIPERPSSWFLGVKDPVVGRAIAAIHASPGADWSVKKLASAVAMSPSRFTARFVETVGESPMAYLSKWRMNIASRQLVSTRQRVEQIAADAGYESQAAFSRAFKKHLGVSPAEWRARAGTAGSS